ncbi:MAG TPA: GNAT family N-acetyltransferase [Stellaceae bacterium]|nr:GNAT family N-acetyltransferase [Stellaceae bacterium]
MRDTAAVSFRKARIEDLRAILELLNDGKVGNVLERIEEPLPRLYTDAFAAIEADPNQVLLVGEIDGRIVASLQLTFIPGIAHQAAWRAQVEAVRVARDLRGGRIGEAMMRHVIALAKERGCALVQLTTHKARDDAQRFYRRLGFTASHEGMKLRLR